MKQEAFFVEKDFVSASRRMLKEKRKLLLQHPLNK